jgi:hypothetical protein
LGVFVSTDEHHHKHSQNNIQKKNVEKYEKQSVCGCFEVKFDIVITSLMHSTLVMLQPVKLWLLVEKLSFVL